MGHYQSNLRDIEFTLFEVLRRQDLLGREPYADLDEQTVRGILAEMNRLAAGPLAESFADGDRHPPVFDPETGSVRLPEPFKKSFRALMDAQWYRLGLPPELGVQLNSTTGRTIRSRLPGERPGSPRVSPRPACAAGRPSSRRPR